MGAGRRNGSMMGQTMRGLTAIMIIMAIGWKVNMITMYA